MPEEPEEPILLTDDATAAPPALIRAGLDALPAAAGAHTSERFIEFFTANVRNRNIRIACRNTELVSRHHIKCGLGGYPRDDRGWLAQESPRRPDAGPL